MILYVNKKNEVKDVNTTSDETLTPLLVNDNTLDNPFLPWSPAKICCYKVEVKNGTVTMYTPYIDSRIVEHIERQGQENINLKAQVDYLAMMTDIEMM
ncbi:MAG: hypothetical protein II304_09955 [Bacteroidales bacterium]|nr:hypothetical protein [Bacteroidales bacterium]